MQLCELLPSTHILVDGERRTVRTRHDALTALGSLLAEPLGVEASVVEERLEAREQLQSTGIGEGVAIPHASVDQASAQAAALLICPAGVPFEAVDGADVTLIVGVVSPKNAPGEHLRILARLSRLLRDAGTRAELIAAPTAEAAAAIIRARDRG